MNKKTALAMFLNTQIGNVAGAPYTVDQLLNNKTALEFLDAFFKEFLGPEFDIKENLQLLGSTCRRIKRTGKMQEQDLEVMQTAEKVLQAINNTYSAVYTDIQQTLKGLETKEFTRVIDGMNTEQTYDALLEAAKTLKMIQPMVKKLENILHDLVGELGKSSNVELS